MKRGCGSGGVLQAVALAQSVVRAVLEEGDVAVDATAGNGHDTVFLAQTVGAAGTVYAIDAQTAAIGATRNRLEAAGLAGRVVLRCGGHEKLASLVPELDAGSVAAVMVNLGYLPGGDKERITTAATTLPGLDAAREFLAPGGVLTVVCYPGHPGGADEAEAVCEWARALAPDRFSVVECRSPHRTGGAPFLVAVAKR